MIIIDFDTKNPPQMDEYIDVTYGKNENKITLQGVITNIRKINFLGGGDKAVYMDYTKEYTIQSDNNTFIIVVKPKGTKCLTK